MMVIQQGDHRGRPAEDVQEDGPWQQWQNLKKGDFGLNLWKSELKKKETQNLKMGDSDPFASKSSLSLIYIIYRKHKIILKSICEQELKMAVKFLGKQYGLNDVSAVFSEIVIFIFF